MNTPSANNKTVVMTKSLGKYLKKGDVVNLKCKMQSRSRTDPSETVAVYVHNVFLHFLSLSYFVGGYGVNGDRREAHALDVTDLVATSGKLSGGERDVIAMLHPGIIE